MLDLRRSTITRQHVVDLLPLMGLDPEEEERLLALRYPLAPGDAVAAFESVGVNMDTLIDRMGGSP